jgi:3-oxoacyl-[acyl-carrier protein] reductase
MNSVAWIVGASGGIGSAIAVQFAQHGIDVAICYRSAKEKADQVLAQCQSCGIHACSYPLDVTQRHCVDRVYQQISQEMGPPSILIHAAGDSWWGPIQEMTELQYDRIMDTHVRGAYYLIQAILPVLLQKKEGHIILISSIWGQTGGSGEVIYSAAKGAQISMVKSLAKELAPSGITINAVAPGAIETSLLKQQMDRREREMLKKDIPLGRLGQPEEVASVVVHLCLPMFRYLTGQVIAINGGWYT